MELKKAQGKALQLMSEHQLSKWNFRFDSAKRRWGLCDHQAKTISLSRHFVELNGESVVMDTILHEIAHALVGPEHGHNSVWRNQAKAIGCSGTRTKTAQCPPPRYKSLFKFRR